MFMNEIAATRRGTRKLHRPCRDRAISSRASATLRVLCTLCIFVLSFPLLSSAQQAELNVAAASDLKFAMSELASTYESQSSVHLNLVFGSSGSLFAQIRNGAPFDLFFSADDSLPRKLKETGIALGGTYQEYAVGCIVLWTPADAKVNPSDSGWKSLLDPSVQKIAVANPEHAPYGRAAIEALKNSGYYGQVKDKLVFGENISQAAQFVQSGNAQIGILAQSLVLAPNFGPGHLWQIPFDQYAPLHQYVVVLESSPNQQAALAFVKYVKSRAGRDILSRFGLLPQPPKSDAAP